MAARRIAWIVLGAVLLTAPAAFAQEEFKEFLSKEDLFSANFPGTPVVTNIMWETEYGAKIPGRVYTVTVTVPQGTRKYGMTVVDYNPVQQIQTERAKSCFQGDERCAGTFPLEGAGYWKNDVRGAMMYAASKYITSYDYHVTHYMWNYLGAGIEVNELQMVSNKDKSRTHVTIYMHHNRLYVMEETTPANYPPPGLFVQSISLKESDGTNARHFGVYFNGPTVDPVEAKTCTGGGAGGQGAGAGGQAAGGNAPGNGGGQPNAGAPRVNGCLTLPADVRFQQGPNFSIGDTTAQRPENGAPAGAPAPAEPRRNH